jgi:hypothetical protein
MAVGHLPLVYARWQREQNNNRMFLELAYQ